MTKFKTSFKAKLGLLGLGILLTFLTLELGLRLAGAVYLGMQSARNAHGALKGTTQNAKTVRILCLGESTTAFGEENAYPRQLERYLNENGKAHYLVFNAGVPATKTDQIVKHLTEKLDQFHPDMVVIMMGVNDTKDTPSYRVDLEVKKPFWENFKTVRLVQMIVAHGRQRKGEQCALQKQQQKIQQLEKAIHEDSQNFSNQLKLAAVYQDQLQWDKAERIYKQLLQAKTAPVFKWGVMAALADNYLGQKKYAPAEALYRNLIEHLPPQVIKEKVFYQDILTEMYLDQGQFAKAIAVFYQRVSLDPLGIAPYTKIGHAFRSLHRLAELQEVLKKALVANPVSAEHYSFLLSELAYVYLDQEKVEEAKAVFEQIQSLNPQQRGEISVDLQYAHTLAGERTTKPVVDMTYYHAATVENLNTLKEMVLARGLTLIAVQYPMRPVLPLKEALRFDSRIIFVDNEWTFKKAVGTRRYSDYFVDHFGGDFGHCTQEGNGILASQVGETILHGQ